MAGSKLQLQVVNGMLDNSNLKEMVVQVERLSELYSQEDGKSSPAPQIAMEHSYCRPSTSKSSEFMESYGDLYNVPSNSQFSLNGLETDMYSNQECKNQHNVEAAFHDHGYSNFISTGKQKKVTQKEPTSSKKASSTIVRYHYFEKFFIHFYFL